jgi:TRAP-type mannitol/chloroaromatic compound transport system substrate-binding protein
MKKRIWIGTLVMVLALSLALGCPPVEVVDPAVPVPPPVITWRLQGHPPAGDLAARAVWDVADLITTMSGGRLVVEPFHGGAIWPTHEELIGVHEGVLDMGAASAMFKMKWVPESSLFSMMGGGLTGIQKMLWHAEGGGDELAERMWEEKHNVEFVGVLTHLRPEVFLHSNVRLERPEDLVGLKIRAAGEGAMILHRMGAATVFFPGAEIYEAMQKGVVDAFEFASPAVNWGMGFQEIARYLYMSPARGPTDSLHVWVNRDRWEELTPDLQAIVETAVRKVAVDFLAMQTALDDEATVKFIDFGVEVLPLPQSIAEAYLTEAIEFFDERAVEVGPLYAEIVASMRAWREIMIRQGIE